MNRYIKLILAALVAMPALAMEAPKSPKGKKRPVYVVDIPKKVQLDEKGYFKIDDETGNSNSLKTFLEQAAQENKAPKSLEKIEEARALGRATSHYANVQLFLIKSENGNQYILKEINPKMAPLEEHKRLERAFISIRLKEYRYPRREDSLSLILPRTYLKYNDGRNDHILVLMQKAEGKGFQQLIKEFQRNPQKMIDSICRAYYDLGKAMAKFYKKHQEKNSSPLERTIIHQDLHAGNIFYNEKTRLITLIDNERMAKSLDNPKSISEDLSKLFVLSLTTMKGIVGFLEKMNIKKWYEITLPSFLLGFIRTYPKGERVAIFKNLKKEYMKQAGLDTYAKNKAKEYQIDHFIDEILIKLEHQLIDEQKTELHIAAGNCDLTSLIAIMIDEGTQAINEQDRAGNTPLHEAAYFGCKSSAELLLKAGAKVNAINVKGETALFKAHYSKQKDLEDLLEKHGAKQ